METEIGIKDLCTPQGEKVFEKIFRAWYPMLVRYANTFLSDMDDAEDTVQQLFIAVWEKRDGLNVQSSLKSYLYRSVQNACLNKIKHHKTRDAYAKEVKWQSNEAAPDTAFSSKELAKKLEVAIAELPEQCGVIFKLSRFEQLKYAEIAEKLGISVKTVENQMGKALKLLREKLKEYLPLALLIFNLYYRE